MTYIEAILDMQTKVKEEFNDELIEIYLTPLAFRDFYLEARDMNILIISYQMDGAYFSLNGTVIKETKSLRFEFKTKYDNKKYRERLFGKKYSEFPQLLLDRY